MKIGTLVGQKVCLEPLGANHLDRLAKAAQQDRSLYTWSIVPSGVAEMKRYVESALASRDAGTAVPFAIVRNTDGEVIGSTRFFDLARWAWPAGNARAEQSQPDTGEIGYTWLRGDSIRTAANTEAKLLMLTQAFEIWQMQRVSFCTDERNERSCRAIERIGAKFEGTLRSHRLAVDGIPRNSRCYAIIAAEWPAVRERLLRYLAA